MDGPIFFMPSTWLPLFGDLVVFFDGLSNLGFFAGRPGVAGSSLSADDGRFLRLVKKAFGDRASVGGHKPSLNLIILWWGSGQHRLIPFHVGV